VSTVVLVVLYLGAMLVWGFESVWSITILLIFVAAAVYTIYQGITWGMFWAVNLRRPVSVEDGYLVQRTRNGRLVERIDLAAPFEVNCRYDGLEWVLYRVSQNERVVKIVLSVSGDGSLVRDVLHQPWPPPVPSWSPYI
jgi:hypothetical protein